MSGFFYGRFRRGGRAIRYIFFMAEKATKKDTAPIPNAHSGNLRFLSSKLKSLRTLAT
jgi:hypothetical protein